MSDCVFCKIVAKEIPAQEVARTPEAIAIRDLNPVAPDHLLVIPVRHAANLSDFVMNGADAEAGAVLGFASRMGREASPGGYRLVVNEGVDAGQTVFHLHIHVLGGRALAWPPG